MDCDGGLKKTRRGGLGWRSTEEDEEGWTVMGVSRTQGGMD